MSNSVGQVFCIWEKGNSSVTCKKNWKVSSRPDLHLVESLSAALALAAASLFVMVDCWLPLPALMEALFTCPWVSLDLGVASGPGAGDTGAPVPAPLVPPDPPVPFSAAASEESLVTPLLPAPVVEVRLEIGG